MDLTGHRYGRLTVVSYEGMTPSRNKLWRCRCDCGGESIAQLGNLRNGTTQSCGCLHSEVTRQINSRHGLSKTPEYQAWRAIQDRCYNANLPVYKNYGARGITVCQRWRDSLAAFIKDMGPRPSRRHSIDRIDNDGNYEPGNCRWATALQQARNRRACVRLTHNGRTMSPAEWAAVTGLNYGTIMSRVEHGWPTERVLAPLTRHARYPRVRR
ncbi:MAG TPA: hypothetical protein VHP62_01805 [Usitatibacter sp.]|jgi:hypothetical protein|nr:hypothetical protein [Usitatibacter sp.]